MQYAVGVSAKRSTHTVDLANIAWVGTITFSAKKVKPHTVGDAVCSRCWCKKYTVWVDLLQQHLLHTASSLHGVWPFCTKGNGPHHPYLLSITVWVDLFAFCTNTYCILGTYCVLHTPLHGFDLYCNYKLTVPTIHICGSLLSELTFLH